MPAESTDTMVVSPVTRSCTKTSSRSLLSPGTRLLAKDWKATQRPLAEIEAPAAPPLPPSPDDATDTQVVVPVFRSWTKTSPSPLSSPGTRLPANESNATHRPSAESAESMLLALASSPADDTDTRR